MAAKLNPYITPKQFFPGSVRNLSMLKAIRNVKSKLNPSQLKRFKASCFGKVFLMSTELKFSGQLIHHLLLRQADHPSDEEMWFVIRGKPARFSQHEFAIITGLNCGEYHGGTPQTTTSRLKDKYFSGQRLIDMRCLKRQFLSCVDEEDTFRLSLVYFLQSVLLIRDRKTTVDQQWLSLVDDLESFNKFPWGKLCYGITLRFLKRPIKAKLEHDLHTKKFDSTHREFNYNLGGFPYAFQVWAYEAIPLLGSKYAVKKSNVIPRILRWETSQSVGHREIQESVFSSKNLDVLKTLRATVLESKQEYMKSIANFNYTVEDGIEESPDYAETSRAATSNRCIAKKFSLKSVKNLSSLEAIQIIKGKLNPSQYERLEASCFGKLFHLPTNVKLSTSIIHRLFLRKVAQPVENEIWFVIGGKRTRFSLYEFSLITGLNCGQYPTYTELKSMTLSTRLKDKYFNGRDMVYTRSLEQQFLSCVDEDDTFKLAMVYFLEAVLLGRCWQIAIDQRWLSLIDDVESFNNFAWGKLSYERTLRSLKTAGKATLTHDLRMKHKKSYRLYGFPYSVQVWAYEAIPLLASEYAEKKENLIPRALCWERKKTVMYKEIDKNVFNVENLEVLETLEASEFESEQDYMKTVSEEKDGDRNAETGKKKRKTQRAGKDRVIDEEKNDDEKRSEVMGGVFWSSSDDRKRTDRKRRKTESYIPFPCSNRSKKKTLVTGETVNLDPNRESGTKDVNDLLEAFKDCQNNAGCLQDFVNDCPRQHDSFNDNNGEISMETDQEQRQSISGTEKQSHVAAPNDSGDIVQPVGEVKNYDFDAFVCDQSVNSNLLSMDFLEQLDAVLQHELDLDFSIQEPPSQPEADLPTTSVHQSHADIEVIELSDDD